MRQPYSQRPTAGFAAERRGKSLSTNHPVKVLHPTCNTSMLVQCVKSPTPLPQSSAASAATAVAVAASTAFHSLFLHAKCSTRWSLPLLYPTTHTLFQPATSTFVYPVPATQLQSASLPILHPLSLTLLHQLSSHHSTHSSIQHLSCSLSITICTLIVTATGKKTMAENPWHNDRSLQKHKQGRAFWWHCNCTIITNWEGPSWADLDTIQSICDVRLT